MSGKYNPNRCYSANRKKDKKMIDYILLTIGFTWVIGFVLYCIIAAFGE